MIIHGAVVRIELAHGFGFIRDDQQGEWFFVEHGVRAGGMASLWVGERVSFSQERTTSGPRAIDIRHESAE